jgi:hypothetical protein
MHRFTTLLMKGKTKESQARGMKQGSSPALTYAVVFCDIVRF